MRNNPRTTWAGVLSLGILAALIAFLIYQGTATSEALLIVSSLVASTGLNALGNIFAKDGDR